jgi:serine/threonine protein kinase
VDLELEELLGVGGFGEVWKARHHRETGLIDQEEPPPVVALKFCLEADAVAVLRHEESVLQQVVKQGGHRGVVRLLHAHLDSDPPCLEYEFVEGEDLGRQLRVRGNARAGSMESSDLRLMRELIDVVASAHRLDPPVVHRDLKPANILVQATPEGPRVRVTDFGIGGLATRQARTQTQTRRSHEAYLLTRLAGAYTPLYASAEQIKGEAPDPRDDVHALGVIWYQLLLGDLSAKPAPDWNVLLQERGVRPEVIVLVGQCLAASKRRLPDAASLARELDRVLSPALRPILFKQQCPSCELIVPIRDPGLIGSRMDCPSCRYRFIVEQKEDKPPAKAAVGKDTKATPHRGEDKGGDRPVKKGSGSVKTTLLVFGLVVLELAALAVCGVLLQIASPLGAMIFTGVALAVIAVVAFFEKR